MQINFSDDAGETFQDLLRNNFQGYCVEITPAEDGKQYEEGIPFDAAIVGPDDASEWYDALLVRGWNEDLGEAEGEPFSVRVASLTIY